MYIYMVKRPQAYCHAFKCRKSDACVKTSKTKSIQFELYVSEDSKQKRISFISEKKSNKL